MLKINKIVSCELRRSFVNSNCAQPGEPKVGIRNKINLTRTSQTVKELSLV